MRPPLDPDLRDRAAKGVGASVDRIGQQPMHRIIPGQMPLNGPALGTVCDGRQLDALLAKPERDLTDAAGLPEFAERQTECFTNPAVRIHLEPIIGRPYIADRHAGMQVAPRRLEAQRFLRALAQDGQFQFAERSFHSQ